MFSRTASHLNYAEFVRCSSSNDTDVKIRYNRLYPRYGLLSDMPQLSQLHKEKLLEHSNTLDAVRCVGGGGAPPPPPRRGGEDTKRGGGGWVGWGGE